MRRLYSTFAGGWPGIGLLLMRLVVGAVVLWHAGPRLWSDPPLHTVCRLRVAGTWRAPSHRGVMDASRWSGGRRCRDLRDPHDGEPPVGRLLAATIAGALAMLGPGRLSVDARLFGWKRIDTPVRKKQFERGLSPKRHARKGPAKPPYQVISRHPSKSSEAFS